MSAHQQDSVRLAAETGCAVITARRWLRGRAVRRSTAYALEQAARKLHIVRDSSNDVEPDLELKTG